MNTLRLKEIREDRNISQDKIAEALNISRYAYIRYEKGIRLMPIDKLDILANFYSVSIDYLICRTDIKRPYPGSILDLNYKEKIISK